MNLRRWTKIGLVLTAVLAGACQEDQEGLPISQFEGPQDVAVICYDDDAQTPLPLNCCKDDVNKGNDGRCEDGFSTANLYAFVTQTKSGEVAVVNLDDHFVIDQEEQIPYNSFIPVGGQPNDIVATEDGKRIYTANRETGDVSVIHTVSKNKNGKKTTVIDSPYLRPASSIDLEGEASQIRLVKSPLRYKDKVALVTQPSLGRLTVLSLDECPNSDTKTDGCVKGYLSFDSFSKDGEPMAPNSITEARGQSIYVGGRNASVILDIQLESLVVAAMKMDEPGEIDPATVVNQEIDIYPYHIRELSIEPGEQPRWMYGIEDDQGELIALNLGKWIPDSENPIEIKEVSVPGKAKSVRILKLDEEGDEEGPLTFNGIFAVVSTTTAGITIIDIEDSDQQSEYFRPHRIRSLVDFDEDEGMAKMYAEPVLNVDGEKVSNNRVDMYIDFIEDDAGVGCDEGAEFKNEYDFGVRFRCDPYESKRETWFLNWKGPIGISGIGSITNFDEKGGDDPWLLYNEDSGIDFCASELYTANNFEWYAGDLLKITSEPTPIEGAEDLCDEKYGDLDDDSLVYRIVGISKKNENVDGDTDTDDMDDDTDTDVDSDTDEEKPNVIEFEKLSKRTQNLIPECFGQYISYEVLAADHWTIRGSRSEFDAKKADFLPGEKRCDYDDTPSKMRVFEGKHFQNDYVAFTLGYGENWAEGPMPIDQDEEDTDPNVEASVAFQIADGYEEMYRVIGATNITDIEMSPDNELLLVDQGEGLIVFDLLDNFSSIGRNID